VWINFGQADKGDSGGQCAELRKETPLKHIYEEEANGE